MADGGENDVSGTGTEDMNEARRCLYNESSITDGRLNQESARSKEHCF